MTRHFQLVAILWFAASTAHGVILDYTLSEESSEYEILSGAANTYAFIDAPAPLGSFTYDFGVLGDTLFSVTWSAPAGQFIEIALPAGFDHEELRLYVAGGIGDGDGDVAFFPADSVAVEGVSGDPLPATSGVAGLSNTGAFFVFALSFDAPPPGSVFRFSSAQVDVTVPASFDRSFATPIERVFFSGSYTDDAPPHPPDPGQWIQLVSIPEPTSVALLLGAAVVATWRRRTAV